MPNKIRIQIKGFLSINDKTRLETEIDVLEGVSNININEKTGEAEIEFDDEKISQQEIFGEIRRSGYEIAEEIAREFPVQEHTYFVRGMHCASCEILIEKRLLKLKGIRSVEASTKRGEVVVEYKRKRPLVTELNNLFREDNYLFFDHPLRMAPARKADIFKILGISAVIIIGFYILNKLGLGALVNVQSNSALATFSLLGLLAGLSTCAALVGGIILSMSKQWTELYSGQDSTFKKLQPHFMFNAGRLVSYAFFGAILGAIGAQLKISLTFTSILVVIVSVIMLILGLQMLGVRALQRFQISTPKFITRRVADEKRFKGRFLPLLMGGLTFFLPCGFTITAQSLALLSGSLWRGSLIMFFFALGTMFPLFAIGFSSVKFSSRPHLAGKFLKVAGVVVLFFALFNINNQLNVLGAPSLNNLSLKTSDSVKNGNAQTVDSDLPQIVGGKQIVKMQASATGYSPNYIKVKVGIPVRWEITDTGTSGCTNAIISKSLFNGQISLTPGQVSVKEFTPDKAGKYKFSCWMGMISGIIEVVDKSSSRALAPTAQALDNNQVVPSGATGCGCGGGNGSSCGAKR